MKINWRLSGAVAVLLGFSLGARAQSTPTPAKSLLVLEKDSTQLDIIDPTSLKVIAHVPVGEDPHEVIASSDGKTAYVSNYMGRGGPQHHLTVIDLVAQKALAPIELGALEGPHGLDFAGGKLYFTAETAKAIGRYDPATQKIDWIMGTGEDRTHMVWVNKTLDKIVTSNVSSGTVSIIEAGPEAVLSEALLQAVRRDAARKVNPEPVRRGKRGVGRRVVRRRDVAAISKIGK